MLHNTVIIGVTKSTAVIFNEEFPNLLQLPIESYNITYPKNGSIMWKLFFEMSRLFNVIKSERKQLEQIIKEHHIDVVISDNRFGLYSNKAECIYITHQLTMQAGLFSFMLNKVHHHYIKKFQAVWIPDIDNEINLAGTLSKNISIKNTTYIGALSRLTSSLENTNAVVDYLILLSGPEPQRSILEELLVRKAEQSSKQIYIVRGTAESILETLHKNIHIINLATNKELSQLMTAAKCVVCRSGYSSLMDLYSLQKKQIVLIATPSQHEQEYLANYWQTQFGAKVILQNNLEQFSFD